MVEILNSLSGDNEYEMQTLSMMFDVFFWDGGPKRSDKEREDDKGRSVQLVAYMYELLLALRGENNFQFDPVSGISLN